MKKLVRAETIKKGQYFKQKGDRWQKPIYAQAIRDAYIWEEVYVIIPFDDKGEGGGLQVDLGERVWLCT